MAIRLEKVGDAHRINLSKEGNDISGEIKINLNWSKGSFLKQILGGAIDLDLGCYYELQNGDKMLIDGLQFSQGRGGRKDQKTRQGCYTQSPWIWHKGDDRGGSSESGETILVNPKGVKDIKTIVVYTFIYEGAAKWADTNAVVNVSIPGVENVIVEMGRQYNSKKFCVIAKIDVNSDNSMLVQKLVQFYNGHEEMSNKFGWGFNFSPGSKD
ncbi:MAG: stress protein [Paludibacteraceae bacterium]